MIREVTLLDVTHPETMPGGWLRVDHPTVAPLRDGEPTLGWEGDKRLVVYLHGESESFVVWRLEHDGEYRPVGFHSGVLTPEHVNQVIRRLVEIDQRRGEFDPYQSVVTAEDERHQAADRARRDFTIEFADKLRFALSRQHLPGVDVAKRVFPLGG